MQYRKLGQTDIQVSNLCLGTMTFGAQNTEQECHEQLDYARDAGINFIDTAEMYPAPLEPETCGNAERIIGTWFKQRKCREKIILASKVVGPNDQTAHIRQGQTRLDRKNITIALEESLKRLQTDYLDLYQLHWPDRDTNFFGKLGYEHNPDDVSVPLEETLLVLADFVKSGKIRYVGLCNETPWGVMYALRLSESLGLPRVVSIQNPYNLLNRTFEIGLAEIAHREHVGLLAYSPLAFGLLSGKYLAGAKPPGAKITLFPTRFTRYNTPNRDVALEAYVQLAQKYQLKPAQMALSFVNTRSFLASTIIGATTISQLRNNIGSLNLTLSSDILAEIDAIHQRYPNPCP